MKNDKLFAVPESSDPNQPLSLEKTEIDLAIENSVCRFGAVY